MIFRQSIKRGLYPIQKKLYFVVLFGFFLSLTTACNIEGGSQIISTTRTARNSVNTNEQAHIRLLLNKISINKKGIDLVTDYNNQNREEQITIEFIEDQQPSEPLETDPSSESQETSSNEITIATHSDLMCQIVSNNLHCIISLNRNTHIDLQAHMLAHQLQRHRIEMDVYNLISTHYPNHVQDFYTIKYSSNPEEETDNNLKDLIAVLDFYGRFSAYLLANRSLKASNLQLNIEGFDLENDEAVAQQVLAEIKDKGLTDPTESADRFIQLYDNNLTILGIINQFFNQPTQQPIINSGTSFDSLYYSTTP